jgi:hypothetical protein
MINNMVEFRNVALKLAGGDIEAFFDATFARGTGSLVIVIIAVTLATLLARCLYRRGILVRV